MADATSDIRTQAPRTYQILRDRIVMGLLEPLTKLKIADLAVEFDVSPGAVREALSRLTTDHLVAAQDQRGFRVAPISLAELDDLTETRVHIEILALRQALDRGGRTWEVELRDAYAAMEAYPPRLDDPRSIAAHARFHEVLVAGCGSPSLMRIRGALYDLTERYRFFAARRTLASRPVGAEHAAIVKATLAHDIDAAVQLLTEHIMLTTRLVRATLLAETKVRAEIPNPDASSLKPSLENVDNRPAATLQRSHATRA